MRPQMIQNPVIPGFYPDPSICRAGNDFYLVCSSFELFPGIPVFHSRNLGDWELVGYAVDESNDFRVVANTFNGGVMAPTIRYHKGMFYVINMNFSDRGNFIVTAKDPRGPWSKPVFLPEIASLDASLFFDDDDRAYIVGLGQVVKRTDGSMDSGIFVQELNPETMKPIGEQKAIWDSALRVGKFPEAPHIYKRNGWYHLVIAEGGTEYYHAVVTARSRTVDGWYEGNPGNPVLTHRQLGRSYPLHNIGHADLVDTPSGKYFAVMLGSRPVDGMHYNLGRETFLCPVRFEEDWPIFSPGTGKVEWEYEADSSLPPLKERERFREEDAFSGDSLSLVWNFWGTPTEDFFSLRDGKVHLRCLARGISEPVHGYAEVNPEWQSTHNVSFIGRRQLHFSFRAEVRMHFTAKGKESAGLIIVQAMNHQLRLERVSEEKKQILRLVMVTTEANTHAHLPGFRALTKENVLAEKAFSADEAVLAVQARGRWYSFFVGEDRESMEIFYENADSTLLNPPSIGTFTGMLVGLFASGNGESTENEAVFYGFAYEELPCQTSDTGKEGHE